VTQPSGPPTAVFLFDPDGRRLAARMGADDWFPDLRIGRLDDLSRALRTLDGTPIRLEAGEPQLARPIGSSAARPVQVLVEDLPVDPRDPARGSIREVRIRESEGSHEAVVQRALGSVLAHQLRTPLTTIYGGAQLIIQPSASSATRSEAARTVAREAQHLHDIVENLLVLLRFDRVRSAEVEPVLLQRVLPRGIDLERVAQPGAAIQVTLPADLPPVQANESHLQHAFRNLLSVALHYTSVDGTVDVAASVAGREVTVVVRDDGPVLGAEEARQAFDLFTRSARTTLDPAGVNLGAFVSRRLVEAMGGRVWATETAGRMETGFALPRAE
jgi:signal transduction histidine kinase